MRVDIVTIFPELFRTPFETSMLGLARERGILDAHVHDLRDYTHDRHRTTDDYPYGGGPGMVMKPEPLFEALEAIVPQASQRGRVVFFTPAGSVFNQRVAEDLACEERLVLVCGRYEGFDERAFSLADLELSIGDYVLNGGEVPALVVLEAVTRLLPGVLGDERSAADESFAEGLLEYPHYTRPPVYRGMEVPDVLLSGDHARIDAWRREQSIRKTARTRPDLLARAALDEREARIADDEIARAAETASEGDGKGPAHE